MPATFFRSRANPVVKRSSMETLRGPLATAAFAVKTHRRASPPKTASTPLTALLFAAGLIAALGTVGDARAEDDIKQLIAAVQSAPPLFRTPEAVSYFSHIDASASLPAPQEVREAAVEGLRATIKLGNMGSGANEAVPILVNLFPRLEHVVAKRSVHFTPGNGTLEDWVQTFVVSEKSNFIFSSPFIEYSTLSQCENWIEAQPVTVILSKKVGKGGKILDALADIFIILRVNAGACALARITGNELGASQEAWRNWYYQKSAPVYPAAPAASSVSAPVRGRRIPFPDIVPGGKYKLHLVTNEDLIGEVTSRNDSTLVLKNREGIPYNFNTVLIEKYEPLSDYGQAASGAPDASADRGENGALTFDDLLKGGMVGKMVEIRIKNGSIFKGALTQVAAESVRIDVEGSEITVARGVVVGIRVLTK
jgi:hypothetical protein